ncbi:LCP family protein [Streptomyces paludis]|uniref:LytR family transcriptional regulator n=1 Tax=Streptomyces paludis TaxID=2282738 RepID=A0A345HM77_9ACTN|nr:LCP family protein [Streptomyces paludis]AXG77801.1 LytR family transcriptional regulator [Streptomyces paludis]
MNDRQQPYEPYDPYYSQPQIVGYDEYGQPVYQQPQQQQVQQQQQGYGYDPYAQPDQAQQGQAQQQYDQYGQYAQQGYANTGYGYDAGQQQWSVPQQPQPQQAQPQQQAAPAPVPAPAPAPEPAPPAPAPAAPEPAAAEREKAPAAGSEQTAGDRDYKTEQFSFIEEPNESSEDVIDWLNFTESRSERREEAKRRGRSRGVAMVVGLALVVLGGVGYLWYAGLLPGFSSSEKKASTASGPQKRDVIVVHMHNTKDKGTSTALLVNNSTAGEGSTLLLPNSLSVAADDGTSVTLGKSVDEDGSDTTRESIGTLFGTKISGTWRLDTPYLDNLVELVGGIDLDTDAEVPGAKKGDDPLVKKGEQQTLSGKAAVAYATYRAPGEEEAKQLQRFGQVIQGALRKLSSDAESATLTVETLGQILDPSLPEKDLGASLAKLAEHAKAGDYKTTLLPVQEDGTLSEETSDSVVKDILGGSVSAPEKGAAARVGVKNASGDQDAAESARIALVNGGYTFVDAGTAEVVTSSRVTYGDDENKDRAEEVAKTLSLPDSAVEKGKTAANADVSVVLGEDYKVD